MKILHICSYYYPATEWGGPVRSIPLLIRACQELDIEAEVFTTNTRGNNGATKTPPGKSEIEGVPVTYFNAFGPRRYFFSPGYLLALLRRIRDFDVVHIHGIWTFPVYIAARVARIYKVPYILTPRGSLDPWSLGRKTLKKHLYLTLFEKKTLEHANLIHYTSIHEEKHVDLKFAHKGTAVVSNALETIPNIEPVNRKNHRSENTLIILGRIHPEKGFDILLPAMKIVLNQFPNITLEVVGPCEEGYGEIVREQAQQLGILDSINFVGLMSRNEALQKISQATILLSPSYRESFGMAVAEAMSTGTPVVVSDKVSICSDIAEFHAGLVVSLEPSDLARAIIELLSSPQRRKKLGKNGIILVKEKYSLNAVGRLMKKVYQKSIPTHGEVANQ